MHNACFLAGWFNLYRGNKKKGNPSSLRDTVRGWCLPEDFFFASLFLSLNSPVVCDKHTMEVNAPHAHTLIQSVELLPPLHRGSSSWTGIPESPKWSKWSCTACKHPHPNLQHLLHSYNKNVHPPKIHLVTKRKHLDNTLQTLQSVLLFAS